MNTGNERRLKKIHIPVRAIMAALFKRGQSQPKFVTLIDTLLPEEYVLIPPIEAATFGFWVTVQHPSFDIVPEGNRIPIFDNPCCLRCYPIATTEEIKARKSGGGVVIPQGSMPALTPEDTKEIEALKFGTSPMKPALEACLNLREIIKGMDITTIQWQETGGMVEGKRPDAPLTIEAKDENSEVVELEGQTLCGKPVKVGVKLPVQPTGKIYGYINLPDRKTPEETGTGADSCICEPAHQTWRDRPPLI